VELTKEGFGKMFCLAGIGGCLSGFIQSAKDVPELIVLDGCQIGCAKALLSQVGITDYNYLELTNEGFEKNKNFDLQRDDVEKVKNLVKTSVSGEITK
jgi:uncharacterized metal-binding protein